MIINNDNYLLLVPETTLSPDDYSVQFVSGDEGGDVQNVGYPDFIQIQNSVRMPVARGTRLVSSRFCLMILFQF